MKDIVFKRSTDRGQTFGSVMTLAHANDSFFYTNPLAVFDNLTTSLWLAYVRCTIPSVIVPGTSAFRNCTQLLRHSNDDGITWDEVTLLNPALMHDGGVGSGIQLSSRWGGRILFPRNGFGPLLGDLQANGTRTWRFGSKLGHIGESQAVELLNGTIVMQMRDGGEYDYIWIRSDDGGETFFKHGSVHSAPFVPDCPTSIILDRTGSRLLMSHPNPSDRHLPRPLGRKNLTISVSIVKPPSSPGPWSDELIIFNGPSGYSSLAKILLDYEHASLDVMAATSFGVLYEKSADGVEPLDFQGIELALFSI